MLGVVDRPPEFINMRAKAISQFNVILASPLDWDSCIDWSHISLEEALWCWHIAGVCLEAKDSVNKVLQCSGAIMNIERFTVNNALRPALLWHLKTG